MPTQRDQRPSPDGNDSLVSGPDVFSDRDWLSIRESLCLSERELAIVKLVFADNCDCEIADELSISRHTVHTHVGRLYRKLCVHSRTELVIAVFWQYVRMHSDSSEQTPQSPTASRCDT